MHGSLFQVGGAPVFGMLFFMSLGFVLALYFAIERGLEEIPGIDPRHPFNIAAIICVAGIAGSRIFFVAEAWDHYRVHLDEIPRFWEGGLSFYGGLAFASAGGLAYVLATGLPLLVILDLTRYIAYGHLVGRVGCLLEGCCYGKPTDGPFGLCLPTVAGDSLRRYPTQIFEFAGLVVLFTGLDLLARSPRRPPRGSLFGLYLIGYGTLRLGLEALRDDMVGPTYAGLHRYQWASVLAIAAGVLNLAWLRVRAAPAR